MASMGHPGISRFAWALGAVCVAAALVRPVHAALTNQYTFNDGTARDSVGGQDGVVVDNTGISRFAGGAIDLTGNDGRSSNQDFTNPATIGAFVDLPNGVFTSAVGVDGQVSLEIWFTVQQQRNWAEVYSFGNSNGGEGSSIGGSAADYVALIPQSGIATPDFRATTHSAANTETPIIGSPTPLPTGSKQHVVLTFDLLDTNGGANPTGTARLYLNNGAPVVAGIATTLDLISDVNNWLGRSPWPDPLFDGTIDEFRIYDDALTAEEVSASFTAGPEASATPTLVIDRTTGAMTIANQSTQNIQLKGYTIASPAGALTPLTWTSIDADNTFDPNGTWTKQTTTSVQLSESVTGGTLDGGSLAASANSGIGTPWLRSPTEDVTFNYTLSDNTTGFGAVQYTGNDGVALGRSDFNADGEVTVADWTTFLSNSFTSFASESNVGAYLKGDLDGDKDNDYRDFLLFKADFIAAQGEAAFAALGAAVPEPGSMVLVALVPAAIFAFGRRRRGARMACNVILAIAAAAVATSAADAWAVIAHRYSFNGNVMDSVGTAHGTIVDGGLQTAAFTDGQLDLSANIGESSNGIFEDAYVDLPNGLITGIATGGTPGALSVELWATISEQHTWQRFVDFGTSNGGEDTSGGGGQSPYFYLAANSGRFNNGLSTEAHEPDGPLREVGVPGPAPIGVQIHLVGTYDQNDVSAGTNGTFTLYNNGALVGTAALPPNLNLSTFTNDNNWIGRSQWPDPVFDGLFNELRLYNHALTASDVGKNTLLGPDATSGDTLKLEVNKNSGAVQLINATTQTLNFDFYRVTSAGNALSAAGWNSLDDQNLGAVDGDDAGTVAGDSPGEGFDQVPGSGAGQLAELFLGASGATINAGQSISLGSAYNTSIFGAADGDLQLTFGLVGGIQIDGTVSYVTGGGGLNGDFDNNGRVDGNDFLRWQRGDGVAPTAANLNLWKANFGAGGASGAAAAVPEPAGVSLALAAAGVGLAMSRRRSSVARKV